MECRMPLGIVLNAGVGGGKRLKQSGLRIILEGLIIDFANGLNGQAAGSGSHIHAVNRHFFATSTGSAEAIRDDKRCADFLPGGAKPRCAPVIIDKSQRKNATRGQESGKRDRQSDRLRPSPVVKAALSTHHTANDMRP
jgi:hypothetical protein